ncbi:MAG: hypothetical protein SVM80_10165 [Halobacteriota archaeon]|nr:hypothetical protein [Halobacteriota archaeon]
MYAPGYVSVLKISQQKLIYYVINHVVNRDEFTSNGILVRQEGFDMAEIKSLIEKIWWVIPPIVVVLGIPLVHIFYGTITSGYPYGSLDKYAYVYAYIIGYVVFSLQGKLIAILLITCMGIGYHLSKEKSLLVRIITPIITAILGYFISLTLIVTVCR